MKKRLTKIILIALSVMLLSFSLVACSPADNGDVFVWPTELEVPTAGEILEQVVDDNILSAFYGQNLTVGIIHFLDHQFQAFAQLFMARNPGVTIELIRIGHSNPALFDIDELHAQINIDLMSGTAPTLIIGSLIEYANPNLFADVFPIMEANPRFEKDNWFESVFDASASDGRLFWFPRQFTYNNVVSNNNIPGLLEDVDTRKTISLREMMDLHEKHNDPANPKYISPGFDVLFAFNVSHSDFVDVTTRTVDFENAEFIDLITRARAATSPTHTFGESPAHLYVPGCKESELSASHNYFFRLVPVMPFWRFRSDKSICTVK